MHVRTIFPIHGHPLVTPSSNDGGSPREGIGSTRVPAQRTLGRTEVGITVRVCTYVRPPNTGESNEETVIHSYKGLGSNS